MSWCARRSGVHGGAAAADRAVPDTELVPYDPGYLAGWTVERYQIDLVAAAERSRQQMDATAARACARRKVPGDTHRNLVVDATYTDQTFKHILAPIWLLTYTYGADVLPGRRQRRHGKMAGTRPWSWIKITLLVLLALAIALTIAAMQD